MSSYDSTVFVCDRCLKEVINKYDSKILPDKWYYLSELDWDICPNCHSDWLPYQWKIKELYNKFKDIRR